MGLGREGFCPSMPNLESIQPKDQAVVDEAARWPLSADYKTGRLGYESRGKVLIQQKGCLSKDWLTRYLAQCLDKRAN